VRKVLKLNKCKELEELRKDLLAQKKLDTLYKDFWEAMSFLLETEIKKKKKQIGYHRNT
jgi:hypothetical protein